MKVNVYLVAKLILLNCEIVYYVDGKAYTIPYIVFPNHRNKNQMARSLKANFYYNSAYYKHLQTITKFYDKRKDWQTSNLGTLLFKNVDTASIIRLSSAKDKTFTINIWDKFGDFNTSKIDPYMMSKSLERCSVNNCVFSSDPDFIRIADVVLVNIRGGRVPRVERRSPNQIWVLYSADSPETIFNRCPCENKYNWRNGFIQDCTKPKLEDFADIFNWTMTYRSDSDVPVPYGRVVPLPLPDPFKAEYSAKSALVDLVPYWREKRFDVIATTLRTECQSQESLGFLSSLMKHMRIDVLGSRSLIRKRSQSHGCQNHNPSDCPQINRYLFYIVLETSRCKEYMTEKLFYTAYTKGAIPVIWGAPIKDCRNLLPPNSYLHAEHYRSYGDLIRHMKFISRNKNQLLHYHMWRKSFAVVNEHGYFGIPTTHFCRLCEALNYNDNDVNVYSYNDLKEHFDPSLTCTMRDL